MINFSFFNLTRVGGWINLTNIKIFYEIARIYKKKINILEIGTHHGRSLIPLIKGSKKKNKVVVMDIFENQKLNISKSGFGSKKIFLKNLKKFKINNKFISIISDSSYNYKKYSTFLCSKTKFDIIHIDGGHSKKEVMNDLKVSDLFSKKNTIFILDDIFNPSFPEVIEVYLKYQKKYYPIFLTNQKLFFTKNKITAKKIQNYIFKNKNFLKKEINFFNKQTYFLFEENSKFLNYINNKVDKIKSLFSTRYHF